jgi:hypothetical protein
MGLALSLTAIPTRGADALWTRVCTWLEDFDRIKRQVAAMIELAERPKENSCPPKS